MRDELDHAPILDYRSSANDDLPDFVYAADELVAENASPRKLLPHFQNARQAVAYYARAKSRMFSRRAIGNRCVVCGRSGAMVPVEFLWCASIDPRSFSLGKNATKGHAQFSTFHPMCRA